MIMMIVIFMIKPKNIVYCDRVRIILVTITSINFMIKESANEIIIKVKIKRLFK